MMLLGSLPQVMRIFTIRSWKTCFRALARLEIIGRASVALSEKDKIGPPLANPEVAKVDFIRHSQDAIGSTSVPCFLPVNDALRHKNVALPDARLP
jgi:hypothetical protein